MKALISLIALVVASTSFAGTIPKDYVNAGKQIKFNGAQYHLKWSDNPSTNYYKQEYLQQGSTLEDYTEMITIDVLKGNVSARQAIQSKVAELMERKKSDPMVNHAVYEKDGKYILDFVLSDGEKILEWNLYRYIEEGKDSNKHLILISYTHRGKMKEAREFLLHLKSSRNDMVQKLDKIQLPKLKIE